MTQADVVIIGAGVSGLSIAYHLAEKKPGLKIIVLEKEKFPGMGSTAQCTGGIRHQFSSRVNIGLTKLSLPYLKGFSGAMSYPVYFRQQGYLFVTSDPGRLESFEEMVSLLHDLDIPAQVYPPGRLGELYPFMRTEDLLGGSFCPLDGYADPHGVTQGYLKQALKRGVLVCTEEEVLGISVSAGEVVSVRTSRREIAAPAVVNAAGPYFSRVAALAGLSLPARPYRRQVYVCGPVNAIGGRIPLTVDMDTGLYIHAEKSGTLLLGGTDRDTAPGLDTNVDQSLLPEFIESAVKRFPALEEARLQRAYVGIRCLTPDYHAILGEAPGVKGFFCAGGFSGHGFMHSPATGMIMSDLILKGSTSLADISELSPGRFAGDLTPEASVF